MKVSGQKGGLLVYIESSLPSNMLSKFKFPDKIQIAPFVLNLRKENVAVWWYLKTTIGNQSIFRNYFQQFLDFYLNEYDNEVVLGYFNLEPASPSISYFMDSENFVNLIKNKR